MASVLRAARAHAARLRCAPLCVYDSAQRSMLYGATGAPVLACTLLQRIGKWYIQYSHRHASWFMLKHHARLSVVYWDYQHRHDLDRQRHTHERNADPGVRVSV